MPITMKLMMMIDDNNDDDDDDDDVADAWVEVSGDDKDGQEGGELLPLLRASLPLFFVCFYYQYLRHILPVPSPALLLYYYFNCPLTMHFSWSSPKAAIGPFWKLMFLSVLDDTIVLLYLSPVFSFSNSLSQCFFSWGDGFNFCKENHI